MEILVIASNDSILEIFVSSMATIIILIIKTLEKKNVRKMDTHTEGKGEKKRAKIAVLFFSLQHELQVQKVIFHIYAPL